VLDPAPHGNPWRTTGSSDVYENPWIRVREDQVVHPDGSDGIYGVVSKPLATGVVAVTDDDEVVLVGQWRYPVETYSWEIVEGAAEHGEPGDQAIRRELREEAGYEAERWQLLVDGLALTNSVSDERAQLYLAGGLTEVSVERDPTEVLEVRHVPFGETLAMVDRGEISDAMTVVALLTLDRRRRRGR
jgi:ADP-ribose pyrophosphatase